jgi:PhnB protein
MTQISPYLTFNGNCREVMTFYKDCFGGELTIQSVKDSPMAALWPDEVQDNVLHASLIKEELLLLASDMAGTEQVRGNTISLTLNCGSQEEIKLYFDRLSEGGHVTHQLHTFFDGTIGALTDKYGVNWVLKH